MHIRKVKTLGLVAGAILSLPIITSAIVLPEEPEEIQATEYSSIQKGEKTASGERYDPSKLSCSHHSLPFGTVLRIQNQLTGRSIDVKVNDRNSKQSGVIALSNLAANQLGITQGATIPVMATPVGITTAQLEPVKQKALQSAPIMVNFDPSAFSDNDREAEVMSEIFQSNAIPVSLTSNQHQNQGEFPTLELNSATPTSSQTVAMNTHGQTHQPVQFVSERTEGESPQASPGRTVRAATASRTLPTNEFNLSLGNLPLRAQFGAFTNQGNAQRLMNDLNNLGFQTFVKPVGELHYVVTKGTFTSQESANHWIKEVKRLHGKDVAQVRL